MNLTETGESRINGYLFVLERSLRRLPPVRRRARRGARNRIAPARARAAADGAPNEREALEKILAELGPPLRVAQAYSAERTIDEAVATGRFVPSCARSATWRSTTMIGFWAALGAVDRLLTSFCFRRDRGAEADLSRQRRRLNTCTASRSASARIFRSAPGTELRRRLLGDSLRPALRPGHLRRHASRRAAVSRLVAGLGAFRSIMGSAFQRS